MTTRFLVALIVLAVPVEAQQQSRPARVAPPMSVYLDVRASTADPETADFEQKWLELSLRNVDGIRTRRDPNPCGIMAVNADRNPGQLLVPRTAPAAESDGTPFKVVTVSLEEHRTDRVESDWVLDYHIIDGEWTQGRPVCHANPSDHHTQRTTELLDMLGFTNRLIAAGFESRPQGTVSVNLSVRAGRNASPDLAEDLGAFLASRIAATPEFTPLRGRAASSSAAVSLDVEISFSSSKTDDPKTEATGKLTVRNRSGASDQTTLTKPVAEFYRSLADATIDHLYATKAAADLALRTTTLEGTPAATLVAQAKTLLCIDASTPACTVQADAALAVLKRLPDDSDIETALLKARAQTAANQHLNAARSYDRVAAKSNDVDQRLDALAAAGDAYGSAKAYAESADRYDQWMQAADRAGRGDDRGAVIAWKRLEVLRIDRQFAKAAETLAYSLRKWPQALGAEESVARLAAQLSKDQLVSLLDVLKGLTAAPSVKRMESSLRSALAANYWREGNYVEAEPLLKDAVNLEPSRQQDLANFYYQWARSTNSSDPSRRNVLINGVTAFESARGDRDPTFDGTYLWMNHQLGDDERSKTWFKELVASNPKDTRALLSLMSVCTDTLADFECAQQAADQLDQAAGERLGIGEKLDIVEIRVVAGRYAAADASLDRIIGSRTAGDYRPIALFYATWTKLALGKRDIGLQTALQWRLEMDSVRKKLQSVPSWVFDGARKALQRSSGITSDDARMLEAMISAMEDPQRPLPNVPGN